jgi:hypothetical protein
LSESEPNPIVTGSTFRFADYTCIDHSSSTIRRGAYGPHVIEYSDGLPV